MCAVEYAPRLEALRQLLTQQELDALLVSSPENRRYLSGFTAREELLSESCGYLLITRKDAWLLTDFRYQQWARQEAPHFQLQIYKSRVTESLAELLRSLSIRCVGFEAGYLTYRQYQRLTQEIQEAGLEVSWQPQEGLVEGLREVKSSEELAAIREALALTEKVLLEVAALLTPGWSERRVAWEIERRLREEGAEGLAFAPIVAAGLNSARPHHQPSDYQLRMGDPIIIDLGARLRGYCADLTRTFILGNPSDRFKEVYSLVRRAQEAAIGGLRAGLKSDAADALGRDVIADAGLGEAFGHSLGHGVGLAVHEAPSLSPHPDRATILKAGSVVTVEPGVYLPDWGGVRLENLVLLHATHAEVLNQIGYYDF